MAKALLLTGNGKTGDSLLVIVLKAETLSVVAQDLNVGQLEVNPVLAVEDLRALLGLGNSAVGVAVDTSTETGKTHGDIDGCQVGLLGRRRRRRSSLGSGLRSVLADALIE
jgi:hypothetical protein